MRIVWDFGGVLFQWRPPELIKRELPQRAATDEAAAHWVREIFQGYEGDWGHFDRGTVEVPDLVQRIARRTGLTEAEVQSVVDGVPHELQPIRESVALLAQLRAAGHSQVFLSNMPAPYAEHLERTHDFLRCFESGVVSAWVQQIKPEPGIFDTAARLFGARPEQLLFIDDVPVNVQAARAAGWQALHFTDAAAVEAQLRDGGWL